MRQASFLFLICTLLIGQSVAVLAAVPADSTGMIQEGGKQYILHKVEQGETLYSLSRRYGADLQAIMGVNPGVDKGLKIGAMLKIPTQSKIAKTVATPSERTIHTVQAGETLYSISRLYNATVEDLKKWNDLTGNSLNLGQKLRIGGSSKAQAPAVTAPTKNTASGTLHIVKQSETLYSISKMYDTSPSQIKAWNNLQSDNLSVGQSLIVSTSSAAKAGDSNPSSMLPSSAMEKQASTPVSASDVSTAVIAPSPNPERETEKDYSKSEKITERGLAEVIEDSEDTRKYLALHRTAPIGTIMQIRNEMNEQIVFVRVVGTVPNTGDNQKVIVKISRKAFDRLGAVDKRFPVELSYIP